METFLNFCFISLVKRFVMIGNTGSNKKECAKKMGEKFGLTVIETGSLLNSEVQKKTDLGAKIERCFHNKEYGK